MFDISKFPADIEDAAQLGYTYSELRRESVNAVLEFQQKEVCVGHHVRVL